MLTKAAFIWLFEDTTDFFVENVSRLITSMHLYWIKLWIYLKTFQQGQNFNLTVSKDFYIVTTNLYFK